MKLKTILLIITSASINATNIIETTAFKRKLFIKGSFMHTPYCSKMKKLKNTTFKPSSKIIPFIGVGIKREFEEKFFTHDLFFGNDGNNFNLKATIIGFGKKINDEHSLSIGIGVKGTSFSEFTNKKKDKENIDLLGFGLVLGYDYKPKNLKNIEITLVGDICQMESYKNKITTVSFNLGISYMFIEY